MLIKLIEGKHMFNIVEVFIFVILSLSKTIQGHASIYLLNNT